MKSGMALERAHIGRKQAEADRAAAITVIDAVDQRRQFLAPAVVGGEQIRLMLTGGHQVEQDDANAERLVPRDPLPAQGWVFLLLARRKEGVEIEEQPLHRMLGL